MKTRFTRRLVVAAVTTVAALSLVIPAAAVDTVDTTITGGDYSASITDLTLPPVAYSHTGGSTGGDMLLSMNDETGTAAGWNVTVQAGDFASGSDSIPASELSLGTLAEPTVVAGQAIGDPDGGPNAVTLSNDSPLDVAKAVASADVDFGVGEYAQTLPVTLNVPGQTLAGTYTSTLVVTMTAGPTS